MADSNGYRGKHNPYSWADIWCRTVYVDGFACASLLSEYPYSGNTTTRFWHRIVGAVVGSFAFFALYQLTPDSFHSFMGPLGGLC